MRAGGGRQGHHPMTQKLELCYVTLVGQSRAPSVSSCTNPISSTPFLKKKCLDTVYTHGRRVSGTGKGRKGQDHG
jgi:hypothetical protein